MELSDFNRQLFEEITLKGDNKNDKTKKEYKKKKGGKLNENN